jgi:3-oxoacyl-[acyl-carrier protein] reductase
VDLGLAGKVGLVTGGSRGIGRAIALRLAAEGCHVGLCGRSAATIESVVSDACAQGVRAHGVVADVTRTGEVERFVDETAVALGGIDYLVANVGDAVGGALLESTHEEWLRTFDLNLFHAARAIRAAVPHMQRRGGGAIVIIASISGWKPGPVPHYGAAKAGEIYLAGALAWELAPHHIRVNTVSPGSIIFPDGSWEETQATHPGVFADYQRREFPAGRLGSPEEVADVAVFALSERARWINGAHIPVDGAQGKPCYYALVDQAVAWEQ